MAGQEFQQPADFGGVSDLSDFLHIALNEDPEVLAMPLSGPLWTAGKRLRVPPRNDSSGQGRRMIAGLRPNPWLEATGQEVSEEGSGFSFLLCLGERMKLNDFHPAGERVAQLGNQQQIGGTREKESPGAAVPVNSSLKSPEKSGGTLNFVQNHRIREGSNESGGIIACRSQERLFIETDIRQSRRKGSGQGAFSTLARTKQTGHRRVGERRHQRGSQRSGIRFIRFVQLSVTLPSNCRLSIRLNCYCNCVQLPVTEIETRRVWHSA